MKFTFKREALLPAVSMAAAAVPSRSPKPVLQCVKLEAESQGGRIMATDGELAMRVMLDELDVEVPGRILISVSRFGMLLRESSDDTLTIETDGANVVVHGSRSEYRLPAQNPDEFPDVADFNFDAYLQVSAPLLRQLIHRTIFATETESSRYALGGVLFEFADGQVTAVGTDGRRLAKAEGPVEVVGDFALPDRATIIPARSLQLIERTIAEDDSSLAMVLTGSDVVLRTPRVVISSRLLEGRFPRWRDVLPDSRGRLAIELTAGPLLSAVRQAAVVADKDSAGIDFRFAHGSLTLSGRAANVGQSRVVLPVAYDGKELILSLDNRYVADFLRVLDPEVSFTLCIQDSESAVLCSVPDNYSYVIMPLARERPQSAA